MHINHQTNYPVISVIIPVYNTAPYLRRCLDSVCGQALQDIEIICVNDASTDESDTILREYAAKDKRVMHVLLGRNLGASAARNVGLALASGAYLGFVDSDDAVDKEFFKLLTAVARETNADIVKGTRVDFYPNGSVCSTNNNDQIKKNKMRFISQWQSAMYKKELIIMNNINFDTMQLIDNDTIFMFKAAAFAQHIEFDNSAKYFCHRRESSLFRGTWDKNKLYARLACMKKIADFCNTIKLSESEYCYTMLYCILMCRNIKFEHKVDKNFIYDCANTMQYIFSICHKKSLFREKIGNVLFTALSSNKVELLVHYLSRDISMLAVQFEDIRSRIDR